MNHQLNLIEFFPMIDIGFWSTLSKKKIEEWKLDENKQQIQCKYKINSFKDKQCFLNLDIYSFQQLEQQYQGPVEIQINTFIQNYNVQEVFSSVNFEKIAKQLIQEQIENIDQFLSNQNSALNPFQMLLITFADLKKYTFSYKLVAPALKINDHSIVDKKSFKFHFNTPEQQLQFNDSFKKYLNSGKISTYFYFKHQNNDFIFGNIQEYLSELTNSPNPEHLYAVFYDGFNQDSGTLAHYNNLLGLILKNNQINNNAKQLPIINTVIFKDFLVYNFAKQFDFKNTIVVKVDLSKATIDSDSYVGFNSQQQPKTIDLKSSLDEATLATQAVDLNIKLMKWRLLPRLDLEKIHSLKVLMFGAGTLGCQLARNLIGWGVKCISFIDYGKVSYSNPVRQSLYDFEDSINGGKPKAETAAIKLKKIFPGIQSEGYQIEIPMPGHYISTEEQALKTLENVNLIEKLVESHDAIYLMTDSRESRWLPTILANKFNKICITIGLGFDQFIIVRHGLSPKIHDDKINGERLSCYFCNDIISPVNTMKDRTLDQQCTVTRPGLSFVSSAYASELLISLIHHPLQGGVPASENKEELMQTDLGIIPQHIRGNMGEFETNLFYGRAFENCVACSEFILDEYLNNRDDFILKCINDPDYLQIASKISENIRNLDEGDCIEFD